MIDVGLSSVDITSLLRRSLMMPDMMGGGFGAFGLVVSFIFAIDLALVGVWLWKQITKL